MSADGWNTKARKQQIPFPPDVAFGDRDVAILVSSGRQGR